MGGGVNIPLPELDLPRPAPNPAPDPLSEFARAAQLRTQAAQQGLIQQQTQGVQQQNQAQALALKDEQLRRSLAPKYVQKDENGTITGFDNDGLAKEMQANGADPTQWQMKQAELQKTLIGLNDEKRKSVESQHGAITNALQSVQGVYDKESKEMQAAQPPVSQGATPDPNTPVPGTGGMPAFMLPGAPGQSPESQAPTGPPKRPIGPNTQKAYQQQLITLHTAGVNIGQLPPVLHDASELEDAEAGAGSFKQLMENAKTQAETKSAVSKSELESAQAKAAGWKEIPGIGAFYNTETKELRSPAGEVMSPAMMESKYVMNQARKNNGQAISAEDQAFDKGYEHMKTLVPTAQINLQAGLLSQPAKEMAAQNYSTTGALPAGLRSPVMSSEILNQAANAPSGVPNIAANKATYQADAASLKNLQKNADRVTAFENTAGKNLDIFLEQAKKVVDSGSPWINKPLRSVDSGALGSADQAAFNAARQTALTEIAKVLSSSNASGVTSDSARQEVSGLIGPNATLKQVVAAANILKRDMANRYQSYQDQIKEIKNRTGAKETSTPPATSSGDFFSQFGGKPRQ